MARLERICSYNRCMDIFSFILKSLLILIVFNSMIHLFALAINRFDVFDIFWGIGFILMAFYNAITSEYLVSVSYLVWILVIAWGLRLSFRLGRRFLLRKREDIRYARYHNKTNYNFVFKIIENYLQIALLQAFLALIIALPIIFIFHINIFGRQYSYISFLGIILAILGLILESWSDAALDQFFANSNFKPNQVLTSGFFAIVRHPNYLGEIIFWSGLYLIALSFGGWWTIVSPILIIILLTQISGVPLVEQKLRQNPIYLEYTKTVPAILPSLSRLFLNKSNHKNKHKD